MCETSRQDLETVAAVHSPGHCQILEITLASCQDGSGTEKKRNGRGNVAIWPANSRVYYITQISPLLIEDNFIVGHIFSFIS